MASGYTIQVEGLKELARDMRRADAATRKELRHGMKEIAQEVSDEAKQIATARGLVLTGRLVKGIRPAARDTTAIVKAIATQRGFNYPARYEFGDRDRPFLVPAIAKKQGEIVEQLEEVVNRVLRGANLT